MGFSIRNATTARIRSQAFWSRRGDNLSSRFEEEADYRADEARQNGSHFFSDLLKGISHSLCAFVPFLRVFTFLLNFSRNLLKIFLTLSLKGRDSSLFGICGSNLASSSCRSSLRASAASFSLGEVFSSSITRLSSSIWRLSVAFCSSRSSSGFVLLNLASIAFLFCSSSASFLCNRSTSLAAFSRSIIVFAYSLLFFFLFYVSFKF